MMDKFIESNNFVIKNSFKSKKIKIKIMSKFGCALGLVGKPSASRI